MWRPDPPEQVRHLDVGQTYPVGSTAVWDGTRWIVVPPAVAARVDARYSNSVNPDVIDAGNSTTVNSDVYDGGAS